MASDKAGGRKQKTRARILEAGTEIFADKGYEAAQISEIAARIGKAHGTVYYHFESKKALLLAIIERFTSGVEAEHDSWNQEQTDTMDAVYLRRIAVFLLSNVASLKVIRNETYNPDPDISGTIGAFFDRLRGRVADGLERAASKGSLRQTDSQLAAVAIVEMVKGVVFYLIDHPEKMDLEYVLKEVSVFIYFGLNLTRPLDL